MTNQEAIETIKANYPPENYSMLREALDIAIALLEEQETVVRCKDCKYYNAEPDSHGDRCDKIHWSRNDDWFCADGVKKE